jgi:hypothetical protein
MVIEQVAGRAREYGIALARIDDNAGDALGGVEPELRPVLAAVTRTVDAVSDRHAVAHPGFAGTHPDRGRLRRIHRDGADRLVVLVENRLELYAAIHRLPQTAAGRAGVDGEAVAGDRVDGRNAPAHRGWSDWPRLEAAEHLRLEFHALGDGRHRHPRGEGHRQYDCDRHSLHGLAPT